LGDILFVHITLLSPPGPAAFATTGQNVEREEIVSSKKGENI
jgi:hypothetical protein